MSRICGICPIAYQMSAAHAVERAMGYDGRPGIRLLRRLFYAASGSKATPCISTCCMRPIFWVTRMRYRWQRIIAP